MEHSASWVTLGWSVLWPAAIVLLTLWLLLVSPLLAVLLAVVLCLMGARRGYRGESILPWRRLIVVGLVLAYMSAALLRSEGIFTGDLDRGGVETQTVTLPAPAR